MPEASDRPRPARGWIVPVLVALVAIAFWISPLRELVDPAAAAAWLRQAGSQWWAPLAFIAAYAVFNLLLVPATLLTLTAGVVWGWKLGGLYVVVASTIASLAPYLIGRAGSGPLVSRIRRRSARLSKLLEDEGFVTLLLLRLVPIVPYNLLNYAAGLAGVRLRDYVLATFVGTLPGIFIFTFFAESIAAGVLSPRDALLRILLAGTLLGGLVLASRLFAGRVRRRLEKRERGWR
ncbi:MAG TPA: TVP38/TMEM64 family protein [Thermoanaerobaculia bacterium]|nr:TVP38/TMEM64 family protein [Thermoanaerobaculia bacterium]